MKILILNYEYPPIGGGAGIVTKKAVDWMRYKGYEATVVTMGAKNLPNKEIDGTTTVIRTNTYKKALSKTTVFEATLYLLVGFFTILRLRAKFKFDIIHAHFVIPTGILAYTISKIFRVPYIITAHGSDIPNHSKDKVVFLHKFTKPLLKLIITNSYKTISPSKALEMEIVDNIGEFENLKTIPHGIEKKIFSQANSLNKDNIIFTVARLSSQKGIDDAIMAYSKINKNLAQDWTYNIIGDGPYRKHLENLANSSQNKISFLGWIPYGSPKYISSYTKGSIMVLPSYAESFGVSILEAMLSKCAIISSDIPSNKSLLGNKALLVKPGNIDALKEYMELLMIKPNKRVALGESVYIESVKHYVLETTLLKYVDVYKEMLKSYE